MSAAVDDLDITWSDDAENAVRVGLAFLVCGLIIWKGYWPMFKPLICQLAVDLAELCCP